MSEFEKTELENLEEVFFDLEEENFLDEVEEQLEQLDEISSDLAKRYVTAATKSKAAHRRAGNEIEKKYVKAGSTNTQSDIQKSISAASSDPKHKEHFKKFSNRISGIAKAKAKIPKQKRPRSGVMFYAAPKMTKEDFVHLWQTDHLNEDITMNPTDVSRSELMAMMVNYANSLGNKEELAAFVAKLPTPKEMTATQDAVYASVTGNATKDSGANKASIKSSSAPSETMHSLPSMKEDLAVLFGDDSGLSEDFRLKTETIFEAAVATRVGMELSRLEESYEQKLEESLSSIQEEMEENVDAYLNYAVAEWIQENQLAIESNIKTEIMESFLVGLKGLFEEHHIEIPEDDIPVVEAMAEEIAALEEQINETTEKNIELQRQLAEAEVLNAADELSEGMTDTQKDKFVKLIESVSYTNANEFRKKASVIKETYFSGKAEVRVIQDQLLNESVDEPEEQKFVAPDMKMYVESLTRSIKK